MSLSWYFHRLRNMEPREIAYRLGAVSKKTHDRFRRFEWSHFTSQGACPGLEPVAEGVRRNATAEFRAAARRFVDRFLDGDYALHGQRWPKRPPQDLFPESLWSLDPLTGGNWHGQDRFCFSIDYRDERDLGDVKFVWDLNRLQFMPALGVAVALWDDERALEAIEKGLESWMRANPPFRGVCWNSGIELGIRAVSLILCASLCGRRFSEGAVLRLRTILAAHLYWLRRYPSCFSSANNHRIYEALGVYAICRAMPGIDPGAAGDGARAILEEEATRQILDDGTGAEQSVSYAAFTVEALLFGALISRRIDGREAPAVERRLVAFIDYVSWLSDRLGRTPGIGDDDGGSLIASFDEDEVDYPVSVARGVAGFFGAAALLPTPRSPALREAVFGFPCRFPPAPVGLKCFDQGGYTIIRERRAGRDMALVFDHGPLGYLTIAAHGHADACALTLTLDGTPILVDAGTYLYHSGGAWRSWFRSTPAHNTLTLGGASQSRMTGPFNWSHKARAWVEESRDGPDWRVVARHDGYEKSFGETHERAIMATANGVTIADRLLPGRSRETAEAVFQFAPGVSVRGDGLDWTFAIGAEPMGRLSFDLPGDVLLQKGAPSVDGGWVSERFGAKRPAPRLVWKGRLAHAPLITRIGWDPRGSV